MKNYFFKIFIFIFLAAISLNCAQAKEPAQKVKGKILLQALDKGQLWYVNPADFKKYYFRDSSGAFNIARQTGLGISEDFFNSFSDAAPSRLSGRILLRAQDRGQAYYVSPDDFKMHYLGQPNQAFAFFKQISLGATNQLINAIQTNSAFGELPAADSTGQEPEPDASLPDAIPVEEDKEDAGDGQETEEEAAQEDEEGQEAEATTTPEQAEEPADTGTSTCVFIVEYFNNNKLIGSPVSTNTEETIDHDWGMNAPDGIIIPNKFSARWQSDCYFEEGRYKFTATFDDAIRIYLDNVNFIQSWTDNNRTRTIIRERSISEGEHEIKVEYYENSSRANIKVFWEKIE